MTLLLIDMLGAKARWREGRESAQHAFRDFDGFVTRGVEHVGARHRLGGIDSDAAALVFNDLVDCLLTARAIYQAAFSHEHDGHRYWLRGVVVPTPPDLGELVHLEALEPRLHRRAHSSALLDAIAVEQSGIKGMRLMVREDLITQETTETLALEAAGVRLHPLLQLRYSSYPEPLDGAGWRDYAWFAASSEQEWTDLVRTMRNKARRAGANVEESLQAAATRVMIDEWRAIMGHQGIDWRDVQ